MQFNQAKTLKKQVDGPKVWPTLNPTLLSRQECQSDFISLKGTRSWGLQKIGIYKMIQTMKQEFKTKNWTKPSQCERVCARTK